MSPVRALRSGRLRPATLCPASGLPGPPVLLGPAGFSFPGSPLPSAHPPWFAGVASQAAEVSGFPGHPGFGGLPCPRPPVSRHTPSAYALGRFPGFFLEVRLRLLFFPLLPCPALAPLPGPVPPSFPGPRLPCLGVSRAPALWRSKLPPAACLGRPVCVCSLREVSLLRGSRR